jgi:hypothetical protein
MESSPLMPPIILPSLGSECPEGGAAETPMITMNPLSDIELDPQQGFDEWEASDFSEE